MKARNLNNTFYEWDGDVLVLNILGTPSAKRDIIGEVKGNQLKISVTKESVAGKATDYMVKFLAKEFCMSASDIEVVYGRESIHKQLRFTNPNNLPPSIERNFTL